MVVQLRIDDRLLHGQIVTQWARYLDIDALVIANDRSANNDVTKQMLLMAGTSTGKKVRVCTVQKAIDLLSDPRADSMKVLLIVDSPEDAIALVNALDIPEVDVANYLQRITEGQIAVTVGCRVNKEQFEVFKELAALSPKIYSQMIPADPQVDFRAALEKAENKF